MAGFFPTRRANISRVILLIHKSSQMLVWLIGVVIIALLSSLLHVAFYLCCTLYVLQRAVVQNDLSETHAGWYLMIGG